MSEIKQTLVTKKEHRHLKVMLTDDEKRELALKLADAVQQTNNLEGEKKSITSNFKAKIEEQQARANASAGTLSNGYEYREVECETTIDYDDKTYTAVRCDTGEIIETRQLKKDELQLNITIVSNEHDEPKTTEEDPDYGMEV